MRRFGEEEAENLRSEKKAPAEKEERDDEAEG